MLDTGTIPRRPSLGAGLPESFGEPNREGRCLAGSVTWRLPNRCDAHERVRTGRYSPSPAVVVDRRSPANWRTPRDCTSLSDTSVREPALPALGADGRGGGMSARNEDQRRSTEISN